MIFLTSNELTFGIALSPIWVIDTRILNSMISNGTIWFILAGIVIIIVAIIIAVRKRKNKKENK